MTFPQWDTDETPDAACPVCHPERQHRPQERLSVTVPESLAEYVRETAHQRDVPVSRIVAEALQHHRHMLAVDPGGQG